jgi:hypothetical protein
MLTSSEAWKIAKAKVAINGDHCSWRQFSTDKKITQSLSVDRGVP